MNKYINTLTNSRGDVLPGDRLQVVTSGGSLVDIFADNSGTPFTDANGGTVNYATADLNGLVQFYWDPADGQVLQWLSPNGNLRSAITDFAKQFLLSAFGGTITKEQVTDLPDDLEAINEDLGTKAATSDLASTDPGKGAELVSAQDGRNLQLVASAVTAVNIDSYGADENFDQALEDAIAAANLIGGKVTATPGKTYYSEAPGLVVADTNVRIDFQGALVVRTALAGNNPILTVVHSFSSPQAVSALDDATINADGASGTTNVTRLTVADSAGWAVGQRGRIVSDDLIPWSNASDTEKQGESFRVALVEPGYIYTYTPLRLTYTTNPRVARHSEHACEIAGIRCTDEAGYPTERNQAHLRVMGAVEPVLSGIRVFDSAGEGIRLDSCVYPTTRSCEFERLHTSPTDFAFGYGIREEGCSYGLHVDPQGRFVRHVWTSSAYGGLESNDARFNRYGGAVCPTIVNLVGTDCDHNAVDCHPDAYCPVFINPVISGQYRGVEGSFFAIKLRGYGGRVIGGRVNGPGAVYFQTYNDAGGDFSVTGLEHILPAGYTTVSSIGGVGGGSDRMRAHVEMRVSTTGHNNNLVELTNIGLTGRLDANWNYNAATSPRLFNLNDSSVRLERLGLTLSGTASGAPRVVYFNDADSSLKVEYANIRAGSNNYALADFTSASNYAAQAVFGKIDTDRLPGFTNGAANAGVSSVLRANIVLNDGVGTQPNVIALSMTAVAPVSQSLAYMGQPVIVISVTATSVNVGDRELTITTGPTFSGQMLIICSDAASNQPVTVVAGDPVMLASDVTLDAYGVLRLIGVGGKWVKA